MAKKDVTREGVEYTLVDDDDLREEGWTEEEIADLYARAEAYERGEWPAGKTIRRGRPRKFSGKSRTVPFRMAAETFEMLDQKAAARGMTRSEALREAVDLWLRTA